MNSNLSVSVTGTKTISDSQSVNDKPTVIPNTPSVCSSVKEMC